MGYRDERSVEYDLVPLPTHEVIDAVAVNARIVKRPAVARKLPPVYTGSDGAELALQPRDHRRQWNDRQWLAFEEHRRFEKELSTEAKPPDAVCWVVRPHSRVPTDFA